MTRTGRAGAIAAAAMICVTLFGALATGALAEPGAATEAAPPPAAIEPAVEDAPRFFRARMVDGLIQVPRFEAEEVRA